MTAGLLAIALQEMGIPARSWQGWQIPILHQRRAWRGAHRSHRRRSDHRGLSARRGRGVAGFQGVHAETGRITTLGRGGSDTSAVALAAAIKADRCDIYTDVDGVYTTDPRIVPKARRLDRVAFEEMLEMASLGAKVLQVRSVELAMVHGVSRPSCARPSTIRPIRGAGTLICDEEDIVEAAGRHRHRLFARRGADHACAASPTSRASPRRSSCRSPRPTSMST